MKRSFALLLLLPSFCFAESLVYLSKTPTVSTVKMQGPQAFVEVAGVKVDQPIAISATGTPVWAVLVTDNQLATINKDAAFLGKGLDAVKAKSPTIYNQLTVKQVTLDNGATVTLPMSDPTPANATVTATDLPVQTFFGYDAKTGGVEAIKPAGEAVKGVE